MVTLAEEGKKFRLWPTLGRLMQRVMPIPECGCWAWTGGVNASGYGTTFADGKGWLAHRLMWRETNGEIPDGLCVLHRCDVRSCVNPDHLFLGTNADNVADKVQKGRALGSRGEANPNAKLSDEDIAVILRTSGTVASIARAARVSEAHIWRLKKQGGRY